MIGIRADANECIATGHIVRCMSIAAQLIKQGEQVIFILADLYAVELLERNGYEYVCLNIDWKEKEKELDAMSKVIKDWNISILLLDSYQVTLQYMNDLKKLVKIAYIDDLRAFEYTSDIIINYALNADNQWYDYARKNGTDMLLGAEYVPLRDEFRGKRLTIRRAVQDVLITTGGTDSLHVCNAIASRMMQEKMFLDMKLHIVVGPFFEAVEELNQLASIYENIVLHKKVTRISDIMLGCDIAISAGGSTLNELCALGIPTICFAIADNQVPGVEVYQTKQLMVSVGDIRKNKGYIDQIILCVEKMCQDIDIRIGFSERQKQVIDGKGVERIAQRLMRLI